jgi:hypothetical protein
MGWKPLKRTISLVSYSSIDEDSWEDPKRVASEADPEDTIKQKGDTADEQVERELAAESLLQRLVRLPNKAVGSKRTRTGPQPPILNQVGEKQRIFFLGGGGGVASVLGYLSSDF